MKLDCWSLKENRVDRLRDKQADVSNNRCNIEKTLGTTHPNHLQYETQQLLCFSVHCMLYPYHTYKKNKRPTVKFYRDPSMKFHQGPTVKFHQGPTVKFSPGSHWNFTMVPLWNFTMVPRDGISPWEITEGYAFESLRVKAHHGHQGNKMHV